MENHNQTSFTFEIDNLSEKEGAISSPIFLCSGCEWCIEVYPKGEDIEDHLVMVLKVANTESLSYGWRRRAYLKFTTLNKSGKVLNKTKNDTYTLFCAEAIDCAFRRPLPLEEEGFLEDNKLIIRVELKVLEVIHEREEMIDIHGFQTLYTQASSVRWIFEEHPDIAVNFRPKNQLLKTAYMNALIGLVQLCTHPQNLSETELSKAHAHWSELTEAGFKLDWLKKKLRVADGYHLWQLKETVKNLKVKLDNEKAKSSNASAKVLSLEQRVSDLKVELDKERSVKSKVASLKDAFSFWNKTKNQEIRAGYELLLPF